MTALLFVYGERENGGTWGLWGLQHDGREGAFGSADVCHQHECSTYKLLSPPPQHMHV